ncbi:Kinesin-like protein KIF13A [Toxocara canis]|uniref:Kinesin-like protein KIF13A n=2 Tax=Toxocara canis TaxID=6265 RepID=A0A0B2V5L0_TOXCA|nr:Kinesin-like protein KIF13A [Toxocara canis]
MAEYDEKVKVAVRVRPFNKRDQDEVFKHVGSGVLNNAFLGYNACIFAYGQTGSGKSYSMLGTKENPGIIPRLCNAIFERIEEASCETLAFKVEVSYMEIYNERVRDLLDPKKAAKNLKVREHKILGPMVDGLSVLAVSSYEQIASLIEEGNKSRTVAATNMNAESSRSHAVFNIRLTQALTDLENGFTGEKMSKISLVDLAGSERAQKSGAVGKRLEEGGNINKSLTTLGMVISALAERSHPQSNKQKFVPYRDSVLTWLLKDNLGGNSRTVMVATISPSADNYEETLSTLRYADRAKKIVNHAIVNEDPNAKVIRELREEVEQLRAQINQTVREHNETEELRERLAESERLVELMNKSWDERLRDTDTLYRERQKDLAEIGISVAGSGIKVEKDRFYLVNLNADPSLNELLVYYVNQRAIIGCPDQGCSAPDEPEEKIDIVLQGLGVHHKHALLDIVKEEDGQQRMYVQQIDERARICVNGRAITQRTLLRNGYRLLIGNNHFFRVNCPKEAIDMNASIMEESTAMLFDYDDAWHEVNSDMNSNPISTAVDQYMEQITRKHEVNSDMNSNPISTAVDQYMEQITRKHEEEKQAALEQQYEAFERYIQGLTQSYTPSTPMTPGAGFLTPIGTPGSQFPTVGFPLNPKASMRSKFFNWAQRREEMFKENLARLKNDIVRANALAREANMIAAELSHSRRQVTYDVTLQIPAANLRPSKIKTGTFVCEPVIVVKRAGIAGYQLWSTAQLENKLIDMREMYNDRINGFSPDSESSEEDSHPTHHSSIDDHSSIDSDSFFESQENHSLIGVANVFLEVLFHDMRLDYQVPIISQQGEVSGRLHVEVYRIVDADSDLGMNSLDTLDSSRITDPQAIGASFLGKTIKCRVRIKKASNLPTSLSHFVFCQYSFFNISEILVVAPTFDPNSVPSDQVHTPHSSNFQFEHEKDFLVTVTEEFLEYVQEDALSIEVWGHRSSGYGNDFAPSSALNGLVDVEQKYKSLQERWAEVTRRIELHVDIKEMNDNGQYTSVEVHPSSDVLCGGIYQLKQGQQRRIVARVKPVADRGNLPLAFEHISSVSIGCVCSRNPAVQKPLDSYQEEDLDRIREQWTKALANRQNYLERQIHNLSSKGVNKSENESEREQSLINQWVALTEERNAVSVPAANSDIPGAPADWNPPPGVEQHVPVLFLDLNADDMTEEIPSEDGSVRVAGMHTILPKEHCGRMIMLPILEHDTVDMRTMRLELSATCSWDSSIHDHSALNKPCGGHEQIYAIVKVVVRVLHPCQIDIILRKRICMHIYKKASLTERLMKRIVGTDAICGTSVYYDVVAHIPKSSLDVEDRATLAMMAARPSQSIDEETSANGDSQRDQKQSYIEVYTKSIQVVESMLKLDRLRQEVAINSMLSKQERLNRLNHYGTPAQGYRMKRAISLPNTNTTSLKKIITWCLNALHLNVFKREQMMGSNRDFNKNSYHPIGSIYYAMQKLQPLMNTCYRSAAPNGDTTDTRRSMEMSTSSSGASSMVTSLVSPVIESTKLSGIDEEQHCNGRLMDNMSKSSTVPETMHSSLIGPFANYNARQNMSKSSTVPETMHSSLIGPFANYNARQITRPHAYGFQRRLNEMIKDQAAGIDRNGNAAQGSTPSDNQTPSDTASALDLTHKMTSSLASDSGCMMESGSSAGTTDEEHKDLSMEDVTVFNNNELFEKLESRLVRQAGALDLNISGL